MSLEIKDLSKSFAGKTIFSQLSFSLARGRTVLFVGPSGCGKTTLFRILLGLEAADSGTVCGLEDFLPTVVFQEDRLCQNRHALANIRFVAPTVSVETMSTMLLAMGLPEDALKQPVRDHSGGMKRRVAIARALLAPGDLLFMDEPLRGMDDDTRGKVLAVIQANSSGRTRLIISHDRRDLVDFCPDQVIRF